MTFSQYSIEDFKSAIKQSKSYAEVFRVLNIKNTGGVYTQLKNLISENNIDISHFIGQGWAKDMKFVSKIDINDYLLGKRYINTHALKLRLIREKIFEHKCYNCNLTEWNNQPIPIELHHIDGNRDNNLLDNLQILCPNCHAQTDNHAGKGKK